MRRQSKRSKGRTRRKSRRRKREGDRCSLRGCGGDMAGGRGGRCGLAHDRDGEGEGMAGPKAKRCGAAEEQAEGAVTGGGLTQRRQEGGMRGSAAAGL